MAGDLNDEAQAATTKTCWAHPVPIWVRPATTNPTPVTGPDSAQKSSTSITGALRGQGARSASGLVAGDRTCAPTGVGAPPGSYGDARLPGRIHTVVAVAAETPDAPPGRTRWGVGHAEHRPANRLSAKGRS